MSADEILQEYYDGKLSVAECWSRLAQIRIPLQEHGPQITTPKQKPPLVYLPINDHERKAIAKLQSVHFGMARGAKRFVQQIKEATELTARQKEYLRVVVFKYRRQLFGQNYEARAKVFLEEMRK